MLSAENINQIEDRARERLHADRSVLVIMAAYDGRLQGDVADFVRLIPEFHFHSGERIDVHCVGYSKYVPRTADMDRHAVPLEPLSNYPFTYFHPEVFHEFRRALSKRLEEYSYVGGVDALLFPVTTSSDMPVDWGTAAIAKSRATVGHAFHDVEEMIRTIINFVESTEGQLLPNQLQPEINRRQLSSQFARRLGDWGGAALAGAFTLLA